MEVEDDLKELGPIAREIAEVARGLGLDFYPVHFEICPAEALYTFGAYGMPVRFNHWSFGKAFHRLKMQYDLNLSRIYELVINSNPAYAFLLEGNQLIQNKLVMAHVYAHVDFFKNNYYFRPTPKDMIERMAAHAQQIRDYEIRVGRDKVEKTIEAILAIQEHVDRRYPELEQEQAKEQKDSSAKARRKPSSPYDELWALDKRLEAEDVPERLECEDLLYFLLKYSPGLEEWQRDIVSMLREESIYFHPQMETKIINEGWATFWHAKILHQMNLSDVEAIEFARMHSQVVQPSRLSLNPYYLGVRIWEWLARHHDLEYLFELREMENDVSFVRNNLNRELVEELNLFNFRKVGAHWQVGETEWEEVRDNLVRNLVHGGHPRIVAVDGEYEDKGWLYLRHSHEGIDLDVPYLEKTLILVQYLWGKPVYLETVVDGKKTLFECSTGSVVKSQLPKSQDRRV